MSCDSTPIDSGYALGSSIGCTGNVLGNVQGVTFRGVTETLETPYRVNIRPLDEGYIVEVGCKSFALSSTKKMLKYLTMYYNDPAGTEKLYGKGKLF
jgi:hypothetical protein